MRTVPGPDDAIARWAIYVGVPVLVVAFFVSIWAIVSWAKLILGFVEHTATFASRLAEFRDTPPGKIVTLATMCTIYILSGWFMGQGVQYIHLVGRYPEDFSTLLREVYFTPFEYTPAVAGILVVSAILAIVDRVLASELAVIPMYVIFVVALGVSVYSGLSILAGILGVITGNVEPGLMFLFMGSGLAPWWVSYNYLMDS